MRTNVRNYQDSGRMRSSFHLNGFWFHVLWSSNGQVGKDQHGNWWYNILQPHDGGVSTAKEVDYYNEAARTFIQNKRRVA
jgi:hypothetical protein